MSPLADAIYHVLAQRIGLANPLVSYYGLVQNLPSLAPPYDNVTFNDERLFRALGEVGKACRDAGLPTLTALVIRGSERSPGSGYYHMFHPEAGDDPEKQTTAWQEELGRVRSTDYPPTLCPVSKARTDAPPDNRQATRSLGHLRFADGLRPPVVFSGHIVCPRCSTSMPVEVERNANAVSPKQPAFLVLETGSSQPGKPIGHLFIGTILSSPVLYYGAFEHCGCEQRVAVFYNRALRDRSDPHLTIMPSISGQPSAATAEHPGFSMS